MISNNYIGTMGRLGNQMFQYSSLRGIADKFNYDYCIPPENFQNECLNSETNIFKVFELEEDSQRLITPYIDLSEEAIGFDDNIWSNCPDNINLKGFFQSEKYFINIKNKIKKAFIFKKDILNTAKYIFYNTFNDNDKIVSLHIRRGDYLQWPQHPVQPIDYYSKAMSLINNRDIKFLIFSDDINWCKKQELFQNNNCLFAQYNSCAVDLCMMTFCDYHIICNSSFSWWGAWLSNSEMVISPKLWFSPPLENDDNFLISSNANWIKI